MNDDTSLYNIEDKDDEAPLYVVPESDIEPEEPEDDDEDKDEDDEDEDPDPKSPKINPVKLLMRIMFMPASGWSILKRTKANSETIGAAIFYPLIAIASLSEFVRFFYESDLTLSELFVAAVIAFVSLFFSNLMTIPLGTILIGKTGAVELKTPFGKGAVMILFSTLAIFQTLYNLLPPLEPVTVFLPLWTAFIVSRLIPELDVPAEKRVRAMLLLGAFVIGMPVVWTRFLTRMLPAI